MPAVMAGGGQRREWKMFPKVLAGCGPENERHYAVSERPPLFNPDCKRKMICPSWGSAKPMSPRRRVFALLSDGS